METKTRVLAMFGFCSDLFLFNRLFRLLVQAALISGSVVWQVFFGCTIRVALWGFEV